MLYLNKILSLFKKKEKSQLLTEANNVVTSIYKAKGLYKELILKAHPDKNPNKQIIAQAITQEVNSNRYNYNELLKLKDKIENELT